MGHIIYRWNREDMLCMGKSEFMLLDHIPGQLGPVYEVMSPDFFDPKWVKWVKIDYIS